LKGNEDDFYNILTIRSTMRMTSVIKKKRALGKNKTVREVMAFAYYIHPLPNWGVYNAVVEYMYATGCGTSSKTTTISLERDF
jgi:hypothetical protein